ncbi:MAG: magnesium chelatase, partial [Spirochaetia bacterium]|nr:magnesium chelatase [Spirochaetia bacterium]
LIEKFGDELPISWMHRSQRYGERLSAGLKISDLIGDIDPSKLISGSPLSSEGALHFGIIPRTNRGIFAINELPDLDYLVQVALFNIMEEGDIQIRGYPFHFPLDIIISFSANPTDYSRSGKIISQLKDRMGSEIRTHYPDSRELSLNITRQEATPVNCDIPLAFPLFMEEVNEELTRQARQSRHINQKSGVSARFSIANYETLAASATRRALILKEEKAVVRPTDMGNIFASSLGKIELDPYRDEAMTEYHLLSTLIEAAFKEIFLEKFASNEHEKIMDAIAAELLSAGHIETSDFMKVENYKSLLNVIPSIFDFINILKADKDIYLMASAFEFILEGLTSLKRITRKKTGQLHIFKSMDAY